MKYYILSGLLILGVAFGGRVYSLYTKAPADMEQTTESVPQDVMEVAEAATSDVNDTLTVTETVLFPGSPDSDLTVEKAKILEQTQSYRKEMEQRSKSLDEREARVKAMEATLEKKLAALEELSRRIRDDLQQEEKIKQKKIKRMAGVFSSMNATQAANIIASMDMEEVIPVLQRIDEVQVGKILGQMPVARAVQISALMTQRMQ